VQITASLTNAAGKGFGYAQVQLERLDGAAWAMVELGRTASDGTHVFTVSPATRTVFRAQFLLPATQPENATYTAPESPVATVVPKVRLSTPVLPKAVARDARVTLSGTLAPRHPAGTGSVVLAFQRLTVDGLWVAAKTTKATLSDVAAGSAYSCVVKLTKVGAWRVRAVHPDDDAHAESASSWRAVTVK
jgi:hypothetical protein